MSCCVRRLCLCLAFPLEGSMNQMFNCHRATRELSELPLTERVLGLLLYWQWPTACSIAVAPITVLTTSGSGDDVWRSKQESCGFLDAFNELTMSLPSLPLVTPLNHNEILLSQAFCALVLCGICCLHSPFVGSFVANVSLWAVHFSLRRTSAVSKAPTLPSTPFFTHVDTQGA